MFNFLKKAQPEPVVIEAPKREEIPEKEYDVTDDLVSKGYINLDSLDATGKGIILANAKYIDDNDTFHLLMDALINIQANIGVTNGETETTKIVIRTLRNTKQVFRKFCEQQNALIKPPADFDKWA